MSYIYLASPYSHPSKAVQAMRYFLVRDHCTWMINNNQVVYSPILHCYHMALVNDLPHDAAFWRNFDEAMLRPAGQMQILKIPGHAASVGVNMEIELAIEMNIHIESVEPRGPNGEEVLSKLAQ